MRGKRGTTFFTGNYSTHAIVQGIPHFKIQGMDGFALYLPLGWNRKGHRRDNSRPGSLRSLNRWRNFFFIYLGQFKKGYYLRVLR
jgi:hypothetical protein